MHLNHFQSSPSVRFHRLLSSFNIIIVSFVHVDFASFCSLLLPHCMFQHKALFVARPASRITRFLVSYDPFTFISTRLLSIVRPLIGSGRPRPRQLPTLCSSSALFFFARPLEIFLFRFRFSLFVIFQFLRCLCTCSNTFPRILCFSKRVECNL